MKQNKSQFSHPTSQVSIQGNLGSYSHIAATHLFGHNVQIIERDNFTDVFEDLKEGRAEYILVPIENSTHGSVYQNYDNLTKFGFPVIGELYLKINFHLIGHKDTNINDLKTLYSHPVGLNQIQGFLRENKNIKPKEYPDTAGSVKFISERKDRTEAAAASRLAAELYGMQILKENIHENKMNYTRFFLISDLRYENWDLGQSKKKSKLKPQSPKTNHFKSQISHLTSKRKNQNLKSQISNPSSHNKTTLQFLLGEEAGSLYKSLRAFADRDIALSKIESRPIINTHWQYRFYVDVDAGINEEKMQNALKELSGYVKELKILGSYRKGESIET